MRIKISKPAISYMIISKNLRRRWERTIKNDPDAPGNGFYTFENDSDGVNSLTLHTLIIEPENSGGFIDIIAVRL